MADPILAGAGEREFFFASSDEIAWTPAVSGPGEVRPLATDPQDRIETRLVRFPRESKTGGAPELLGREVFIVSGDFEADGERLEPGDFHRAVGASVSGRTESGCVVFTLRELGPEAGTGEAPDVGTLDPAVTIRAPEGAWIDAGIAARWKRLAFDPAHGVQIFAVHMDPDSRMPSYRHAGAEELFVLRGDCLCQGRRLGPGDYHRSRAGARHEPIVSEGGCEVIVVRHGAG